MRRALLFTLLPLWVLVLPAFPRQPRPVATSLPRPYDGIRASEDAWRRHEERRLDGLRRQLDAIEAMKWYAGYPTDGDGTVWYRDPTTVGGAYGPRPPAPVRQPLGQRHIQTGPNTWESHPVYLSDVLRALAVRRAELRRRQTQSRAILQPRPDPQPQVPPPAAGGPREF